MTATVARTYACQHCSETFSNPVKLGGHVHARHPDHRRSGAKSWAQLLHTKTYAERRRPARSSLKRDTDTWPGKP